MAILNTKPFFAVQLDEEKAYFIAGNGNTALTDKYIFSTDSVSTHPKLAVERYPSSGVSNSTVGLIVGSTATVQNNEIDKWTMATDTSAAATSMSIIRRRPTGFGNETTGYLAAGHNGSAFNTTSDRYTYANDTLATGGTYAGVWYGFGAGTQTTGYSWGTDGGEKTNYSNTTTSATTTLLVARGQGAAAISNYTLALINGGAGGSLGTTERYTFSGDTVAVGATLSVDKSYHTSATNLDTGLIGSANATSVCEKYSYTGNTFSIGTSLLLRHGGTGFSNAHGGL